jgi:hypothetical protein
MIKKFIFLIALILMLLNVTWANAQCGDLTIDSETVTQPACPGDTGVINFTASCTTCTGPLEYFLLDSTSSTVLGPQANGNFTGLIVGDFYRPLVVDSLNPTDPACQAVGSLYTINAPPVDITPPTITSRSIN